MCWKVIGGGCVGKGEGGGLTAVLSDSLTLPPVRSGLPNLSNERMPNPNDWPALGGSICCGMRTWEWRSENGPGDTMSVRSSTIRAPLSVGGARSSTLAPARSGLAGSAAWFSAQSSSQYVPALVSSCALNVQRPVRCSPVNGSVSGGVGNSQPTEPLAITAAAAPSGAAAASSAAAAAAGCATLVFRGTLMPFERRRRGRVGFDALAPMLGPRTCHALLLLLVEASLPLWRKHDFTAAAALGRLGHNADAIVAAWRRGGLLSRLLNPKERFDYGHHRSVRARAACRRCRHGRCELGLLRPAPNRGRVLHRRHALLPACPRAPRDAVGNDVGLAPEAKTDESSSSVADIKAVLTAASGRSLPLSVVRLPCGQLEVRAVAFCTRCTFRTMVLPFVAHRGRSPCVRGPSTCAT